MKEEVRELWNLCFGDNEAFTELYFSKRYSEEVNLAVKEDGKVISAMQILPYPMTFCGTIIPTGYISGACTHPDFRNKGAMKRLLFNSFIRMQEKGIPLAALIPAEEWLFEYYSKMGFTPEFEYTNINFIIEDLSPSPEYHISEFTPSQNDVYSFFNKKMRERACCFQHSADDFNIILDDLHLGEGKLFVSRLNGEVNGVAFCYSEEEELQVPEMFFENESVRDNLLYCSAKQMNVKNITCIVPPINETGSILGMARIVDAEKMLHIYAAKHKELEVSFNLVDEYIENNNAFYSMKSGKIEKGETKEGVLKITIQQLTQALLGYRINELPKEFQLIPKQTPYMSLMLD